MTCRTGLLCLLAMVTSVGCNQTNPPPISAPANDGAPPRQPADPPN